MEIQCPECEFPYLVSRFSSKDVVCPNCGTIYNKRDGVYIGKAKETEKKHESFKPPAKVGHETREKQIVETKSEHKKETIFYESEGRKVKAIVEIKSEHKKETIFYGNEGRKVIDLEKTGDEEEAEKNRRYTRVDTFFKVDFRYHPGHNGVISGRASILNLSEGGMYADQVLTIDEKTGKIAAPHEIEGQVLYDMEFSLKENSDPIKMRGKCVRVSRGENKLSAGIRFKDMRQDHKGMIKEFVNNRFSLNPNHGIHKFLNSGPNTSS